MKLGDNQRLALSYLRDGITVDELAKKMQVGQQRALDLLERLVELGLARHAGSRKFRPV